MCDVSSFPPLCPTGPQQSLYPSSSTQSIPFRPFSFNLFIPVQHFQEPVVPCLRSEIQDKLTLSDLQKLVFKSHNFHTRKHALSSFSSWSFIRRPLQHHYLLTPILLDLISPYFFLSNSSMKFSSELS